MSINKSLNEHTPRIRRFPCSRIQKDLCRSSALEEEGVGVHDHVLQKRKQSNFPGSAAVKNLPAIAGSARDIGLIPWSGRSPGRGNGSPLQYSSLENPYGQRSPAGCSPRGHKESDMTEQLNKNKMVFRFLFYNIKYPGYWFIH